MSMKFNPAFLCDLTLSGAGVTTDHTVSREFELLDAHCIASAAVGGGTMAIQRQPAAGGGFNALSSALVCAVIGDIGRSTTWAQAQMSFARGDTLRLLPSAPGVNGRTICPARMSAIAGA